MLLTTGQAAQELGCAVTTFRRLVQAELLPGVSNRGVRTMVPLQVVQALRDRQRAPLAKLRVPEIAVVRVGVARRLSEPDREWMGFSAALGADDLSKALRAWWRCDPASIAAGRVLPVTLAGYVVAVLTGLDTWKKDDRGRHRFSHATVTGYVIDLARPAVELTASSRADRATARLLLGSGRLGTAVRPRCHRRVPHRNPHSSQAHRQAALLLWTGLSHHSNPLPAELSDSVWETITTVLHTPPSSTADSPDDDDQDYRWGDAREQALRAAVAWACWHHRHGTDYSRLFTTLEAMLTELPLAGQRGEQAVATVIGSLFNQLHALDPAWARNHIPLLSAPTSFGRTAWHAYLSSAHPAQPTALLLLDAYRTAARTPTSTDNDYQQALRRRLGEHLLILYLNGQIELNGHDSPLEDYYASSSPKTTQEFAGSVGETLHAGDLPEEVRHRLQAWWEWRVAAVARELDQDPSTPSRDELLTLVGPLVSSRLFPANWLLEQLSLVFHLTGTIGRDARVFTFLAATAADTPGPVLELLTDWVLTLDVADWSPRLREADLRTILLAGLRAPDHHDLATEIINRAAARGHRQFRPLLLRLNLWSRRAYGLWRSAVSPGHAVSTRGRADRRASAVPRGVTAPGGREVRPG